MIRSSKIGPAAQLLLDGSGLAATDITPTGPGGIITKGDVLAAVSIGVKPQQAAQPAAQQAPPQAAVQPPPEQQKAQQAPKAEVKKDVASEGGVQSGKVADQKPSAASVSVAAPQQQPFEPAVQQKRGGSDWKLRAILAEKMIRQGQRIPDLWLRDWVGAKKQ